MAFHSVKSLLAAAENKPLWQAVWEDDCRDRGAEPSESWEKMSTLWTGMVGGSGLRMEHAGETLCGPFIQSVISTALKTGECNACMGRIVAAPTAGASGVMPAVLLPTQEKFQLSDDVMVQALYVAAGFGQVIATRASISGAEGGCQAEIGSASAMAAAGLDAGRRFHASSPNCLRMLRSASSKRKRRSPPFS